MRMLKLIMTLVIAMAGVSTAYADDTMLAARDMPMLNATFHAVILDHFKTSTGSNTILGNMTPFECQELRQLLVRQTGSSADVDAVVASTAALAYVRKWFNTDATAQYKAKIVTARIKAGPAPTTDLTPLEIYYEYRTSPFGSLSVASAMYETAYFISSKLIPAFGYGYAVGTTFSQLMKHFDPLYDDALGATISNMLEQIVEAGTDASRAQYKAALKALFGLPPPVTQASRNDPSTITWKPFGVGFPGAMFVGPGFSGLGTISVGPGFFDDPGTR